MSFNKAEVVALVIVMVIAFLAIDMEFPGRFYGMFSTDRLPMIVNSWTGCQRRNCLIDSFMLRATREKR